MRNGLVLLDEIESVLKSGDAAVANQLLFSCAIKEGGCMQCNFCVSDARTRRL